jgi:DNA invertase Pin-like site-specific DNA recombinase
LQKRQISVHSIALGGDIIKGKLFDLILSILAPLGKMELKLPGERVRARKQRERQIGRYLGGNPPLGYIVKSDGRLEADGTKKRLIRKILRLKASGMSLRKIASELQYSGIKISHSGVDKLLKSAAYMRTNQ